MPDPDPIQTVSYAEEMAVTEHANLSSDDYKTFCESVLAEESAHGMDRSRARVSFVDEIVMYDMGAANSLRYKVSLNSLKTIVESYVRVAKPADLLVLAPELLPMIHQFPAQNVWVGNSIHLDYAQRHGLIPEDFDFNVVMMQQVDDGNLPVGFEMALVNASYISHNFEIVDRLYNSMPSGASIVVTNFSNSGNLYRYRSAHQYHSAFRRWQLLDDVHIYPIPLLFGVYVITKA